MIVSTPVHYYLVYHTRYKYAFMCGLPHLSHSDLAFMGGESFEVTLPESGDYEFQCDPHAGAGMRGVIHVE